MHQNATLNKWYEERGRHFIYAGNKNVELDGVTHTLLLRDEDVHRGVQTDLDEIGVAKTARDEKRRARNDKKLVKTPEDEKMEQMYREVVLKEEPKEKSSGLVQLDV